MYVLYVCMYVCMYVCSVIYLVYFYFYFQYVTLNRYYIDVLLRMWQNGTWTLCVRQLGIYITDIIFQNYIRELEMGINV